METRIYVSDKIRKNYKKLFLNELPVKSDMEKHLNSWNANYVAILGKRCWVITHSITRYTVIVPDVKAIKLEKIRFFFLENFMNQLLETQNFEENLIQSFVGEFKFYPTNGDKSAIAYINKRIEDINYWKYELGDLPFSVAGSRINHLGTKLIDGKSKYIRPTEQMLDLINEYQNSINKEFD